MHFTCQIHLDVSRLFKMVKVVSYLLDPSVDSQCIVHPDLLQSILKRDPAQLFDWALCDQIGQFLKGHADKLMFL